MAKFGLYIFLNLSTLKLKSSMIALLRLQKFAEIYGLQVDLSLFSDSLFFSPGKKGQERVEKEKREGGIWGNIIVFIDARESIRFTGFD